MKKLISFALALVMLASLSVSAFATSVEPKTAEVKATYSSTATTTVYKVDIKWEGLSFTYESGNAGTWNPDAHAYESPVEPHWTEGTGTITVTNHSNAAITASASYAAKEGFEAVRMAFNNSSLNVATADNQLGENGAGKAVTGTITVTPTGTLPAGTTDGAVIGTITITIK